MYIYIYLFIYSNRGHSRWSYGTAEFEVLFSFFFFFCIPLGGSGLRFLWLLGCVFIEIYTWVQRMKTFFFSLLSFPFLRRAVGQARCCSQNW